MIIPNLCQECHKHHHTTFVKECRLCSDLQFHEQILCNLVRDEITDENSFECYAFRPKLSVVSNDRAEQSETEDVIKNTEGMSQKEKWFKAYAVQQLRIDPDQTYFNIRYHVVFSTVKRAKLFSNQHDSWIDEFFQQSEFPFENTNVHLLYLAPDHMHLYIDSSPDYSLDEIVNAVMAYSEREIPIQLPESQQNSRKALWERAYFLEDIG